MTLYPNIIYHPDTDTTIFIDTLQEFNTPASSELVTYQSAVDGTINTFERETLARTMSLSGKIGSDNVDTLRRQLQYLRGKQVYLMLGARNLATLAKIRSFDMPVSVGTYTPLALDVVCEGSSEGQFWEAEELDSVKYSNVLASGGWNSKLISSGDHITLQLDQDNFVLPAGNYTMFARAYDQNNITNDFGLRVLNNDDVTFLSNTAVTLSGTYGIVTADFTVSSSDIGDDIRVYVNKETATSNVIYVDFFGFVRTD